MASGRPPPAGEAVTTWIECPRCFTVCPGESGFNHHFCPGVKNPHTGLLKCPYCPSRFLKYALYLYHANQASLKIFVTKVLGATLEEACLKKKDFFKCRS
jgi:uncharacterized C2H2 Zn-finger protein